MTEKENIDPWDVSGNVDYSKLTKEFGLKDIDVKLKNKLKDNILDRRGLYAFHRDFDKVIEEAENGKMFFITSGIKPSGPMHLGHSLPMIMDQYLQEKYNCPVFIPQSDDEAYYVKDDADYKKIDENAKDNLLDIIAFGFDPENTFVFKSTEYLQTYKMASIVAKKTTFNTAKAVFGETVLRNIGWTFYPAIQSSTLLIGNFLYGKKMTGVVPIAIDQDPYLKIARDIAVKLDYPKPASIETKFFPGLEGFSGKMSTSKGESSAIFLSDSAEIVKKKINKYALTGGRESVEKQRQLGGEPDKCVVYAWHLMRFESDDKKVVERKERCKSGCLLCGECKNDLITYVNDFLKKHQDKKKKAESKVEKFKQSGKLAKKALEMKL